MKIDAAALAEGASFGAGSAGGRKSR